jgi:hypothetical protein
MHDRPKHSQLGNKIIEFLKKLNPKSLKIPADKTMFDTSISDISEIKNFHLPISFEYKISRIAAKLLEQILLPKRKVWCSTRDST